MIALWHGAEIIKNDGRDSIFKNAWRKNVFEVEKYGHKNSEIQL